MRARSTPALNNDNYMRIPEFRSHTSNSRLAAALVALLLSACATQPPVAIEPVATAPSPSIERDDVAPMEPSKSERTVEEAERLRYERFAPLTGWRTRGKVAYRSPDDSGSATVDWYQNGPASELRLSGPLGMGNTRISPMGDALLVERDGIERVYPADAAPWLRASSANGDALLPLPIKSIPYWIRGFADPSLSLDRREFDNDLPSLIEQDGWSIRIERYRNVKESALPSRLQIVHSESQLSLKLILRRWEFD
ncbi:MAG: lipoprotein insertase outer membrane protein LolB [Pseudomonadota bacterium]